MFTKECAQCGKQFQAKRETARYCSFYCSSKFQREKQKQKNPEAQAPSKQDSPVWRSKSVVGDTLGHQEQMHLLADIVTKLERIMTVQDKMIRDTEQYMVPSQACKLLSINRSTFDRFVRKGIFRIYRLGKGKVYVKRSEIDQLFLPKTSM